MTQYAVPNAVPDPTMGSGFTGIVIPSQPIPGRGLKANLEDLAPNQLVYLELSGLETPGRKVYLLITRVTGCSLKGFIVGEEKEEKEIVLNRIFTIWIRASEVNDGLLEWMNYQVERKKELSERLGRIEQRFAKLLE